MRQVEPNPSALSTSKSREGSEAKSRRSAKTKDSQALTEVVDNRTENRPSGDHESHPSETIEEDRDPPSDLEAGAPTADTGVSLQQQRALTPLQLLPGLEGDDIIEGLTSHVDGARSSWRNVLGYLSGSREGTAAQPSSPIETTGTQPSSSVAPPRQSQNTDEEAMPHMHNNKTMRSFVSPNNEIELYSPAAAPPPQGELSFWERLTCYTAGF